MERKRVAEQFVAHVQQKGAPEKIDFINSGSTLLNLALSQKGRKGGWARGRIANIVGDGGSGKTLLALEACAQFYHSYVRKVVSPVWGLPKKLHIAYNNVEGVMDMPIEEMFTQEFVDFVEWIPEGNELRDEPMTVEAMGRDLLGRVDALPAGEAIIYVVDSLDALTTEAGIGRMDKSIKNGKPLDGSYGTGPERAKYLSSEFFNSLCSRMSGKDVTVIFISQVRQKLDAVAFGEKYYRAGGKSLDFYTHQVAWLAQIKKLDAEYKGKKRIYGVRCKARVKRNKVAVPFREAEFDILFNYGIDNLGSCAEFLSPEMITEINGKRVSRVELVKMCEADSGLRNRVIDYVEKEWATVEEETAVKRGGRWTE